MNPNDSNTISTPQQFSVLIDELGSSSWTLAAIGALFDSGLADQLRAPATLDELAQRCPALPRERIQRCLAVAVLRGVVALEERRYHLAPGVLPYLDPPMRTVLEGDYRSYLLQPAAYLRAAAASPAPTDWRQHTDPVILQAQGAGSAMFAGALKANLAKQLGDLAARLERPEARFLDVGTGVGALSIAMCRAFPALKAVGLDPYEVPLQLARASVSGAGLGDRIELRQVRVQEIRDEAAFDLAWLPPFFLRFREEVADALARIRHRPAPRRLGAGPHAQAERRRSPARRLVARDGVLGRTRGAGPRRRGADCGGRPDPEHLPRPELDLDGRRPALIAGTEAGRWGEEAYMQV